MFQLILPFQLELPFEADAALTSTTGGSVFRTPRSPRTRRARREVLRTSLALDFAARELE